MLHRHEMALHFTAVIGLAFVTTSCSRSGSTVTGDVAISAASEQFKVTEKIRETTKDRTEIRISIENFTFNPATVTVSAGTKVTWINHDDVPHTVRSDDDLFQSGTLDTDDAYSYVFTAPSTFGYYCGVHRHMAGTIVVP